MKNLRERPSGPSNTAPTSADAIPHRPSRSRQCCQHVSRSALVAAGGGNFREAFGVGDGTTIHVIDMMGALLAAVQALFAKVERLENADRR